MAGGPRVACQRAFVLSPAGAAPCRRGGRAGAAGGRGWLFRQRAWLRADVAGGPHVACRRGGRADVAGGPTWLAGAAGSFAGGRGPEPQTKLRRRLTRFLQMCHLARDKLRHCLPRFPLAHRFAPQQASPLLVTAFIESSRRVVLPSIIMPATQHHTWRDLRSTRCCPTRQLAFDNVIPETCYTEHP